MKKQIQLVTFVGEIGLKGTTSEIEPFYKAIKRCCESLCSKDQVDGQCRVYCSSDDHLATKRWELKIICPPLPGGHAFHHKIEGVIAAAAFDKRVCSWGHHVNDTQFKLGEV